MRPAALAACRGIAGCVGRLLGDAGEDDAVDESSTGVRVTATVSVGDSAPSDDEAPQDEGGDGTPPSDLPSVGCGDAVCLSEASRTEVGTVPDDIAVADLDADGLLDVVVANSGSGDATLLHGWGDGTFSAIATLPLCAGPRSVAVADFDVDGDLDLVFACADDSGIVFQLGDGFGAFSAGPFYPSPYAPVRIFAAQIDGDGRPDVLVANYYGAVPADAPSYSILTQPTPMQFVESAIIAGDLYAKPGFPRLGDVDLDGDLDLVAGTSVAFGDGNGAFPEQAVLDPNSDGIYALHDIDADGVLDLAMSSGFPDAVAIWAGTGTGDFVDAGGLDATSTPTLMEFGDLDGDGGPDLVAVGSAGIRVWRWEADFGFDSALSFDPENDLRGLVVVDLDGDGRDDVLVASSSSRQVIALLSSE